VPTPAPAFEDRCGHISLGECDLGEQLRTAERPAEAQANGTVVVSFEGTLQTETVYRQDSSLHRGRRGRCTKTPQCSMITSGSPPTRDPSAPSSWRNGSLDKFRRRKVDQASRGSAIARCLRFIRHQSSPTCTSR
jgi:hypothetical protein